MEYVISDAPTIWRLLNGVLCVYKPAGVTVNSVRRTLLYKLSTELNELECRPPVKRVAIDGDTRQALTVTVSDSLADNPLVVGPRYRPDDFKCSWATFLGVNTSGVFVIGLNSGTKDAYRLHREHPLRTYKVKGRLGECTDNLFHTGKVVDKSTWRHVRRGAMEKLLANMQASHQKTMYQLCGVDLQSEAAYELASKGLVRPVESKLPLIYGIRCVEFEPPNFIIEVNCINEYESYLLALVHDIAVKLHTVATCVSVRCTRHSCFTLQHALLMKHWTLQSAIANIAQSKRMIRNVMKTNKNMGLNSHLHRLEGEAANSLP
ncbi:hypothetical protein AAG570_011026 [Ranatra chinensis]|uniref:Pseudouridine synthase II N-terminal domain-containing protein n=1 Tax=Ranatra chinensis TaxID=642074 RepID=A0ABD0YJP9_9HEMI